MKAFRSLKHRNFRIYFLGQLVSLNGTWMQSVAQAWLMYRLTESGLMLGLAGALTLLPNLLFGLYGGLLADRVERRRLLIIVQTLAMLQALTLAVLTLGGWVQPWHILALALALGLVQAVETPARQSFLAQLVPKKDLANTIALNSSMFHTARFIGPALAGALVALAGEGPVFAVNAVSFLAVLLSLFALKLPDTRADQDARRGARNLWSGLEYAWSHRLTRALLGLVATVSLCGAANTVLMPLFVVEVFTQGAESLGLFMGMMGAGSLTAALLLAHTDHYPRLERRVFLAAPAAGVGMLLFALNPNYWLALPLLFGAGMATTTVFASSNALIQLAVPDRLRGRTMALYTLCLHGMFSVGQLTFGALADQLGAPMTMAAAGGMLIVLTGILLRRGDAAGSSNAGKTPAP